MQDIKDWLVGERDFHKGVTLLTKYNRRTLAANLGKKENEYHKQKLAYELGKIANVEVERLVGTTTTVSKGNDLQGLRPLSAFDKASEDKVELLYREKAEIWQRESALRNRLVEFEPNEGELLAGSETTDKVRQALIDEINAHNDRRTEIESLIRAFEQTGKLPETQEEVVEKVGEMSIQELFTRKNNLISYISRESKKLETLDATTEKYISVAEKLAKFKLELDEVNDKLNS